MKATPNCYYGLEITAENDAEKVWLAQFLEGFTRDFCKTAGTELTANISGGFVIDHDGDELREAIPIELMRGEDGKVDGLVDSISLNAGGL